MEPRLARAPSPSSSPSPPPPHWTGLDQDVLYILSKGEYQAQNVPQARRRKLKNSHEEVLPTQNREALL